MNVQSSVLLVLVFCGLAVANEETKLIKVLFRDYGAAEKATRGVNNVVNTLNVDFGLAVLNVLDMDTTNGFVTLSVWNRYSWTDSRLRWNHTSHHRLSVIRIPSSFVFVPDIVLYNPIPVAKEETVDTMAVVSNDGSILWIPPATLRAPCLRHPNSSVEIWRCTVKFGSWTYDGYMMDVRFYDGKEDIDMADFQMFANGWNVTPRGGRKNIKYYPCCTEPYPDLTFQFDLSKA